MTDPNVFAPKPGQLVILEGEMVEFTSLVDLTTVLVKPRGKGKPRTAALSDLQPLPVTGRHGTAVARELFSYTEEELEPARRVRKKIRKLLGIEVEDDRDDARDCVREIPTKTRAATAAAAADIGISTATMYRRIAAYDGTLSSLVALKRNGGEGKNRLGDERKAIANRAIAVTYPNANRKSIAAVVRAADVMCKRAGLKKVSRSTIGRMITNHPNPEDVIKKRLGRDARDLLRMSEGETPEPDYPLQRVQIDTTPLDVIVVDEKDRTVRVGRVYLTLVFDVFSRCVLGFCVTLKAPSMVSVGEAIAMAVLEKDSWLRDRGLDCYYPMHGLFDQLEADGGSENNNKTLKLFCQEWDISFDLRPLLAPQAGGHVERMFGTIQPRVHEIPGTTFSNIHERGTYDSQELAIMTRTEVERWVAIYIAKVYHITPHSGLGGMIPLEKYQLGILGNGEKPGRGTPRACRNPQKLRIDLWPMNRLTVQDYGLKWDGLTYWAPVLRQFHVRELPSDGRGRRRVRPPKQRYIVRRNGWDVSTVKFWDPKISDYHDIPWKRQTADPMSADDLKRVKAFLGSKGGWKHEDDLHRGWAELRKIETEAAKKTAKAKRQNAASREASQRRGEHKENARREVPPPNHSTEKNQAQEIVTSAEGQNTRDFTIFDEIVD
jgi:putative transposase